MATVNQTLNLALAEGAIDPSNRLATGEIALETLDHLAERLTTDEFYDEIDPKAIPCMCVDGRCGHCALGPNAAGGTFSVVMGDALTGGTYRHPGEKTPGHAKRIYKGLLERGFRIGGHDDTHATGDKSGCGAQDKLDADNGDPSILEFIVRKGQEIRELLAALKIEVSDDLHDEIIGNAQKLRDEGYATSGLELRQAFVETAGSDAVDTVEGDHAEVLLIVNTKVGQTLNRQKLQAAFGDKIQVFELDVPGLINGANAIALSDEDAPRKFIGSLYYNVATAGVLAGPGMNIGVR